MKKYISIIVCLVILVTFFCSCGKNGDNEETKYVVSYSTTTAEPSVSQNSEDSEQSALISSVFDGGKDITNNKNQSSQALTESVSSDVPETQKAPANVESTENLQTSETAETEKKGELVFSDSADNKYIQAVVKKYGADADNLAAIYVVPDGDENTVLEFDGSKDENGKRIRTKHTLIGIYSIDKDMNIIMASLDEEKTEHSKTATVMAFALTIKYMLPEFEDELNS